jgi:hypothetical protein
MRKRLYFEAHFLSFVLQQDSFGGIYLSIINRNIALFGEIRKSLFQEKLTTTLDNVCMVTS